MPHDDDAAHHVSLPVEIGDSASKFGTDLHLSQLFDENRSACFWVILDDNIFDVFDGFYQLAINGD